MRVNRTSNEKEQFGMYRVQPARMIPVAIVLAALLTVAFVSVLSAAAPTSVLVAQAPTGTVTGSVVGSPVAISTVPAGSVVVGTASAPSPAALATDAAASAIAPPSLPPPVAPVADTGGGIDGGALVETIIGVILAVGVVGLGAWGLIRLIATA
jgi:hypothetical protein